MQTHSPRDTGRATVETSHMDDTRGVRSRQPIGRLRVFRAPQAHPPSRGSAPRRRLAFLLLLLVSAAEGRGAELRPTLSAGYAHIVGGHVSLSGAVRVQIVSAFFVQAEYLALRGDRHTDHGPTLLAGLSGKNKEGFRPFLGLGGGPVKGYRGDNGLLYLAVGATQPIGGSRRAFLQGEFRAGLLGESAYQQFTLGIGVSR